MQFDKFVKKIKTQLDVEVHSDGRKHYFTYGDKVCSFFREEKWDRPGTYVACNFHMRRIDDHSDMMTDYFAGSFFDNGTQLLNYLKPPAPKFPVGTLVRGKDNKRATRNGYAGRLGLVVDAGSFMRLHWADGDYSHIAYPARDFEKVS